MFVLCMYVHMYACMCSYVRMHLCTYACMHAAYVTVFWKTDRIDANTEIHFLFVDENHTRALIRDTKHLRLDGQVCFFFNAVKP